MAELDSTWRGVYRRAISRLIALTVLSAAAILAVAFGPSAAGGSGQQVRIGMVLEQPLHGRNSDPFQYGAYQGLLRATQHLPVVAKAVAPNPSRNVDPYPALLSYLAGQNYNLVIALGALEAPALSRTARVFRHEKFALLDGARQWSNEPANVEGIVFHTEQAAYLAGFVAARMADRSGHHVVSSVAGVDFPPVDAYVAGFRAGAKRADPKIRVLNTFTNDFTNRAKCRSAAQNQIALGSQVVFDVAGGCGIGALEAAQREHVYGIGVDIDMHKRGRFILTSVLKNLNRAVYDLARRLVKGRVPTGGNVDWTLRNHGVSLGKFSPAVPRALQNYVLHYLAPRIEQGKIAVPATLSPSR